MKMSVSNDYSKYASIANQTRTIEVNGEKIQVREKTTNAEQWANVSQMHSSVNNGDTYFCTDGSDDGEITGTEKASLFAEGMWDSTKDKAIPTAVAAGAAVGIKAVAGSAIGATIGATTAGAAIMAAAPVVLGAAAVVGGIYLIGKGISSFVSASQQAENATTDSDAKSAWNQMGYSTVDTAYGVAATAMGAKQVKNSLPEAMKNPTINNATTKAKGFTSKIKNFFSKLFKKGKTGNTSNPNGGAGATGGAQNSASGTTGATNNTDTNQIKMLEAPKGSTTAETSTTSAETATGNTGAKPSTGTVNSKGLSFDDATSTTSELLEELANNPTDKALYNKIMKLIHPDLWANATEEELSVLQYLASKANTTYTG